MLAVENRMHPRGLLPSLRDVAVVCPLCHGALDVWRNAYYCPDCAKTYPLHAGIPDFRVFPDPYLSLEEDRQRTDAVLAALPHHSFASLLEHYWSLSESTPPRLRARFVRGALLGEMKARRITLLLPRDAERVLEVGCGTGNFLAVAEEDYPHVVGVDAAMRWLHLSRRRFLDRGRPVPPLICCCAEHLPLPDGAFDLVVSAATLEFARDQRQMIGECARALSDGGRLFLSTANRYSLAADPFASLWGVGFLPRRWQAAYVKWRRGANYTPIRLLSLGELDNLAATYFTHRELALPEPTGELWESFSPWQRLLVRGYRLTRKLPLIGKRLRHVVPQWDVLMEK